MRVSVSTDVLVPVASYDLVDLDTAKAELGIKPNDSSQDVFLKKAIKQASRTIANECDRVFQVETVVDTINFDGRAWLDEHKDRTDINLSRWPVVDILSVSQNSQALVLDTDYRVDNVSGVLHLIRRSCGWCESAALSLVVKYRAGYTRLIAESKTIPTGSPYTVSVDNASTFVLDKSVVLSTGAALSAAYSAVNGTYQFGAADAGKQVAITYAFSEIPDDLVLAALKFITMRFSGKGRDPWLMERTTGTLGTERYWVGTRHGQGGALPPEIADLVANYRVPTVA